MKLRAHFKDINEIQTTDQLYQPFKVKNKTKWTSNLTHHTLKDFIDLAEHDIIEIKIKKVKDSSYNLSNGKQETMKHFVKRRDIIMTTADKDDVVVVLDTENCIKEAYLQLSDKNDYKTLQTDPTLQDNKMVNDVLHRFENENLLSKKVA